MKFWSTISNLGITEDLSLYDKRIIVLTNRIIYFSFVGILSFVPLLYFLGIESPLIPSLILSIISVSLFAFAINKRHQLSLLLLFCVQIAYVFQLTTFSELMSPIYLGSIIHLFLIPNILIGIVLMKNVFHSLILAFVIIFIYGLIEYYKYKAGFNLTDITTPFIILYIFDVVLIFTAIYYYIFQFKLIDFDYSTEIINQNNFIENQHHDLNLAHTEQQNSIEYAKKIQSSILSSDKIVKDFFEESFIFFRPKDIVAGDFYWSEQTDDYLYFAVADCTGHGVPGALVSIVCNNALNRSLREFNLTDTGKILDKTRELVINEFEKSDENVMDGMDIALVRLPKVISFENTTTLQFSGAYNPLWIIRDNNLIEHNGCRQPIGKYYETTPFVTKEIEVFKNDKLYIFSDGYVDQFGGEKGKKYKTKSFRKLLIDNHLHPMTNQRLIIKNTFNNWKQNIEQVDDICVVGFKL